MLKPLLGDEALSKSAISRVVGRLKPSFKSWRTRDLGRERYAYLYLDAMFLPVRLVRRVVRVPVHAVLGVREDGQKVLLVLEVASSESTTSWTTIVQGLAKRGLPRPKLVVLDGNPGLSWAVRETWPGVKVQPVHEAQAGEPPGQSTEERGKHTTLSEHMRTCRSRTRSQKHRDWSPSRLVRWGESIGQATGRLVEAILENRRHPEQVTVRA